MLNHFYQKNKEKLQKYNGLLMTNPIMERIHFGSDYCGKL